MTMTIIKHLH